MLFALGPHSQLYLLVLGEIYIKSGRAIPSSESHNFQHLKLGGVVSSTSFIEVVQNVEKVIIFS